jgi:hypothetical protein
VTPCSVASGPSSSPGESSHSGWPGGADLSRAQSFQQRDLDRLAVLVEVALNRAVFDPLDFKATGDKRLLERPFTNGHSGVSRYGAHDLGGAFCGPDGPAAAYSWAVNGNELTLTARSDPCRNRRAVVEGTWTHRG